MVESSDNGYKSIAGRDDSWQGHTDGDRICVGARNTQEGGETPSQLAM